MPSGRQPIPSSEEECHSFMEIERKFLVSDIPRQYSRIKQERLAQGYLTPTGTNQEIRVRRAGKSFFLTIKGKGQLARREDEIRIPSSLFRKLWALTTGARVCKLRRRFRLGAGAASLDTYCGKLQGLKTVEVEFASRRAARVFRVPIWFGCEVTYDDAFKNRGLAANGVPRRGEPKESRKSAHRNLPRRVI
jgi:CYTH domain-containing protein